MNNNSPYEDILQQKLHDISLPDESQSWKAMELLLDNEYHHRTGGFLIYGGFVLMAISLPLFFWLLMHRSQNGNLRYKASQVKTDIINSSTNDNINHNNPPDALKQILKDTVNKTSQQTNNTLLETEYPEHANHKSTHAKTPNPQVVLPKAKTVASNNSLEVNEPPGSKKNSKESIKLKSLKINTSLGNSKTNPQAKQLEINKIIPSEYSNLKKEAVTKEEKEIINTSHNTAESRSTATGILGGKKSEIQARETDKNNATSTQLTNDSLNKIEPGAMKKGEALSLKKDSATSLLGTSVKELKKNPVKVPKGNEMIWSAGIGIQQKIPVAGQSIEVYSSTGSKNIIGDYIPSIYVRAEKPQRWFAQAEFNYSSPQSVKELAYSRKTLLSDTFTKMTTTTYRLKKTFYHNIPLSFNYYITSKWTIGAGAIFSLLHRAVAEQQVTTKNLQTQQESSAYNIIPSAFSDSFLYKSQWHWLIQSSYEWRKFSFGLRYGKDAESYIKFTKPTGEIEDRKNWSLEFFVRFRLWQSK